jgi:nucleolysin TIA-1/TIAR
MAFNTFGMAPGAMPMQAAPGIAPVGGGFLTPVGAVPGVNTGPGASAGSDAPKKPHLYIGNLSPRVTDQMLVEIFSVAGNVVSAKIIQDRNFQHGGFNYGFVEYADMRSAEQALTTLNGRKIFDAEVRVNWAYQGQASREDTQHHYHVFVGDLSPDVNDDVLGKAFIQFASLSEARVMWDMNSGKSRGYGFLSFR